MPYGHNYNLRHQATISTAISAMQLLAGSTTPFEIVRASVTQRGSTTSAQEDVALVRKSAAATVTAAVAGTHLFKDRLGDPTADLQLSTSGTGVIATAEGTDTDVPVREGFNVLNGWLHLPVPEKRQLIRASAIIALKFMTAPASQTWDLMVELTEKG